jgi:hypothetical protein
MSKKLRKMSIVVFEPAYGGRYPDAYKDSSIELGEQVLYLDDIPNAHGHCAVAKRNGKIIWLMHSEDFREATREEI